MNDGNYVVVFDLLQSGYRQWWFPAAGLLMIPFSFVIFSILETQKRKNLVLWKVGFIAFTLLWVLGAFIGTFAEYWNCSQALASGKASYVEGTVDNFVPMPYQGHADESFTVRGVSFSYSDFGVQAGFNNTSSHGGPIRQGQPVRIWYVGREIVKLEIKR
jgi:hypothetical protein